MYPNIHNATSHTSGNCIRCESVANACQLHRVRLCFCVYECGTEFVRCAHDSFCIWFLCNFWWPPLTICNWTNCGYVIESFLWFFFFCIYEYCVQFILCHFGGGRTVSTHSQRVRGTVHQLHIARVDASTFRTRILFTLIESFASSINFVICLLFFAAEKHQHVERIEQNCDQHREHSECQQKGRTENTWRGELA